jgi:hypothetical protein
MIEYPFANKQKKNKEKNKQKFITSSNLILFAFASAFFSRVLESLGAPAPINFLHFFTIPSVFIISICTSHSKNRQQLNATKSILFVLVAFFLCIVISTLINDAGIINAILDFLLLGEPFLLLISIISIPMSSQSFSKFKKFIINSFFIHIFLVYIQKYVLKVEGWDYLGMEPADRIQGVFFISGAGHVVGASVSLTFAVYYLISATRSPLWLKILVALATIWHIVFADAKQVILVFMIAGVLLFLTKLKNIYTALQSLIAGILIGGVFWWCIQNVEAFSAFNTWIRPEIYGPNGEATLLKTATFRIVPTHYQSNLNWLFGLGPGHTVGRLGGWMLKEYASMLQPLGATTNIASSEIWNAVSQSWLGSQSSMFSPLFGWAGIWGDLGFIGLGVYLYLAFLVWHYFCKDDISRFILLTVFAFALIFSQLEEPGYMLSIASIIGLQWQENKQQQDFIYS